MVQISIKMVYDLKGGFDAVAICELVTKQGMVVERVIPSLGIVFGSCDDSDLDKLASLEGVLRVSSEGTFQLPPLSPDTPQ